MPLPILIKSPKQSSFLIGKTSKMETVEQIKKLRNNVFNIRQLFNEKLPRWQADRSHYDKVRCGFVVGNDDGLRTALTLCFSAWMGTYGSSSTYNEINLDAPIFHKHLLIYLNENKQKIMLAIADSIEKEAAGLKEKAEAELAAQMASVKELDTVIPS